MALKLTMAAVVVGLSLSGISVVQAESLNIVFTCHSSASNTFWQAVKKGFNDACSKTDARCQMIFTQTEGSIEEQQANMQAAIARHPDALITSIVDDHAFDQIIADAREEGIIVIAANVDDSEGAKGNERQAFIGQNFIPAGYALSQAISAHFPAQGPIHVLVGLSAPGQNWLRESLISWRLTKKPSLIGSSHGTRSIPAPISRSRVIASGLIWLRTPIRRPISIPASGARLLPGFSRIAG
jgi:simple sugar transport system substrate-binding protein